MKDLRFTFGLQLLRKSQLVENIARDFGSLSQIFVTLTGLVVRILRKRVCRVETPAKESFLFAFLALSKQTGQTDAF